MNTWKLFLVTVVSWALISCNPPEYERPEGVVFDKEKQHFVFTEEWLMDNDAFYERLLDRLQRARKREFYGALNDEEFKQLEIDQAEFLTKLRERKP